MSIEYLACGNVMSDRIKNKNNTYSNWNMGGPAFFALAGIRLWTEKCKLICRTGKDFEESYGVWMDKHSVSKESVNIELENTTRFTLEYTKNGAFIPNHHFSEEHLGYLKTHPEDITAALTPSTKGIYLAQNTDRIFWEKLGKIKKKNNFKIMWEVEYAPLYRQNISANKFLEKTYQVLETADMWSVNLNEASHLFGIPREKDDAIIKEIQKLKAEMMFYRVGKRGAYAVTPTNAYFCKSIDPFGPSVDPTGCGNNSTAAAMYAYVSGESIEKVAIMANVSSGFNAAQHGPYPLYTEEKMKLAKQLLGEYCAQIK